MKRLSKQSSISTFIKKNKISDSNLSETIETINEEQTIEKNAIIESSSKLILTDFWIPPNHYNFPIESTRNLKFQSTL